jgi:hypothetical protein
LAAISTTGRVLCWSFITEEEIAAKEKDIKRLRVRLGLSRWCKRYAGQMEQARILVQVLRRQN